MIVYALFLYSCLFAALVPAQCSTLSAVERYLYAQLEDALVNDAAALEQLREVFFQKPPRPNEIQFHVNITADSALANNCTVCPTCEPAFCRAVNETAGGNTSTAQWKLCSQITITWKVPSDVDAVDLIRVLAHTVVPWLTHGLSFAVLVTTVLSFPGQSHYVCGNALTVAEPIKLSVKKLDCHPYKDQLIHALGEFFSWIEVYTEAGGKPLTWNPQHQAYISVSPYISFSPYGAYWLFENHFDCQAALKALHTYGVVGCLLLNLSLLLLIPRLFLEYHNKIVHKSTRSAFGSLYWGTAIVSLFLVVIIMPLKLLFLSFPYLYISYFSMISHLILEILIPIVFLVISIIAIASKCNKAVPMPAAKFTTHVLFCCCCCFCCSSQSKSKGVQVLALWAFMTGIYCSITEAVALIFTFFISIPLTISYALMYISVVFFAIMVVSIILFSCQSTGRSKSIPAKLLSVVDVCATLLSISFIIHVFIAFIAMSPLLTYLKVKGFESVSLKVSLLPSIALSVAGWLIRKKLLKEDSTTVQPAHLTDYGATGHSLNDGQREDEEEQAPEEQQHLLT